MTEPDTRFIEPLKELVLTITELRGEQGCPWDRKQTPQSLLKYLRSECEELITAIENNDPGNICEESGDVVYIIIMLAQIHAAQNQYDLSDVFREINTKLVRRHPHVFAGTSYESEEDLARQWQEIKALEKKKKSI